MNQVDIAQFLDVPPPSAGSARWHTESKWLNLWNQTLVCRFDVPTGLLYRACQFMQICLLGLQGLFLLRLETCQSYEVYR